jgi:hypothetical protein
MASHMKLWAIFGGLLTVGVLLISACGEIRPLPPTIEPQNYTPITYQQLLAPGKANLRAGQKIRVQAYFWEFLTYDPAMVRNYLSLARHPLSWPKLRWFALYDTKEMKGYYELAALDAARVHLYKVQRMDQVLIYGELASLGSGLYLHVHHLEKVAED